MERHNKIIYASLIMGICLVTAGFFISQTLLKAKELDRYVTVKGLSEREVEADVAVWPVQITVVSNDLQKLERDLTEQTQTLKAFFAGQGFTDDEITVGSPSIQDKWADFYGNTSGNQFRYLAKTDFTIRTGDIEKLHNTLAQVTSIISKGIILGSKNYWQQVEYIYTGLNDIKPEMIEEATKNARAAAEKFARDSDSKVGKIKSANQGLFSISNRDINTGHIKKVRVVNTVVFYLED